MTYVPGIDLGTSYFKLGLFDHEGGLCGLGRTSLQKDEGDGTRCELTVDHFWKHLNEGLQKALTQAEAKPTDISAIGYSSQANSFLLLDEQSEPLTPLILWPGRRAESNEPEIDKIWERDDFHAISGMGMDIDQHGL